ncbi:hypothetical protein CJ030_MR2G009976 [Morella rubra]|uniref:Uncharacterized protein n=1 Tax=Morella rubra TaxID=262757 RepID=A0A6A1WH64_9ROSI|nr:hypothetical protein CJ030_MR2G009976 [Morella rubra]
MQYLMKRLMKYFNRSNPKTPYKQLVKVEKARPVRVHKGHVPIYVGEEEKIGYEVPLKYLSLPSFQELFVQSAHRDGH